MRFPFPRLVWLFLLLCPGLFPVASVLHADAATVAARNVTLPAAGHPIVATLFPAAGEAKRPAVILLHGRQGLAPFAAYYRRQAEALAEAGMDAYLLTYYDAEDLARANSPDPAARQTLFRERAKAWAGLVRAVAGDILAGALSSGRVGLLGFSQGGFLAAGVAGTDPRVAALVVYYGGVPNVFRDAVGHLPPLLELHGDADAVVAPAAGKALVDLALACGGQATMQVFPGAGHGFSGDDAGRAQKMTVDFLRRHLLQNAD